MMLIITFGSIYVSQGSNPVAVG